MALAETARLIAALELDGRKFFGPVDKAMGRVSAMERGFGRVGKGAAQMGAGVARAGVVIGAAAVTGIAAATKATIDWQDAFAGVVKTVDEADLNKAGLTFRDLEMQLRKMSTTMPIAATDLARIAEAGGALGIAGKDITEFTRVVAMLASTTDLSADAAATSLGQLSNVLGMTAADFDNFSSALVDLGNKGASTESQILEVTTRAGALAKAAGLSADQVLGWSAALANLGMNNELAGSSFQRFVGIVIKHLGTGGKKLDLFARTAGMSAKEFKKAFAQDASGALEQFVLGLAKLPIEKRAAILRELQLNGVGLTTMFSGLSSNTKNLTDSLNTSEAAWKANIAAQEEFEKRNATVKSALQRLQNSGLNLAVTFGEGVAPAIGRAADRLAALVNDPQGMAELSSIAEDVGKFIDSIDWREVISGAKSFVPILKGALGIAQAMFRIFNALPGPIKEATVGFLALNKLSGGMLAGGATNVIGGLLGKSGVLGGLFNRGASPANPMWVAMVGGGAGGATGVLGGAGGKLGALKTAGAVGFAALSVLGAVEVQQAMSEQSSQMGKAIGDQTDSLIKNGETSTADLEKALAAVNTGIDKIQSNPLHMLVQGSALDELKATRAKLEEALAGGKTGPAAESGNAQGRAFLAAIRVGAEAARGGKGRLSTIQGGGQAAALVGRDVVMRFERSQAPFYRDVGNMTTYLAAIKAAQEAALARGDTTVATELAALATRLETKIGEEKGVIDKQLVAFRESEQAARADAEKAVAAQKVAETKTITGLAAAERAASIAGDDTSAAAKTAGQKSASATDRSAGLIIAAIDRNRPVINISATTVTQTSTVSNRTGPRSGSQHKGPTPV